LTEAGIHLILKKAECNTIKQAIPYSSETPSILGNTFWNFE
jgi:hypothetical protein